MRAEREAKRMGNDAPNDHRRADGILLRETPVTASVADCHGAGAVAFPKVTVFRCVNHTHSGTAPASAAGHQLSQPQPEWPIPAHEIALPCTGKLQPEHLLKAFEAGADAVCVLTCAGDSCHYLEGSRRAERRVEYVRELLDEIGLGGERLLLFHLAASAQEQDAAPGRAPKDASSGTQPAEIRDAVMARLGALQPNPLRRDKAIV